MEPTHNHLPVAGLVYHEYVTAQLQSSPDVGLPLASPHAVRLRVSGRVRVRDLQSHFCQNTGQVDMVNATAAGQYIHVTHT